VDYGDDWAGRYYTTEAELLIMGVNPAAGYRVNRWLWSVGAAYDTSPTDEDTRPPDLPLDRQIRIGTGIQYDWNNDMTVGVAYEYLDAGDAEIDQEGGPLQGSLKGDYDTNAIHFFAVNLIWKF
jgi:long-chain fatty acid transport protein